MLVNLRSAILLSESFSFLCFKIRYFLLLKLDLILQELELYLVETGRLWSLCNYHIETAPTIASREKTSDLRIHGLGCLNIDLRFSDRQSLWVKGLFSYSSELLQISSKFIESLRSITTFDLYSTWFPLQSMKDLFDTIQIKWLC